MKTAIVTGSTGNMGHGVVKKFIEEGYFVAGTVLPNDSAPVEFPGDKFEKIVVDLGDEDDAQKFVEIVIAKHKTIDAAVLTVGGFAMGSIADTKTSDIEKQYKLNFETAYNVARPAFHSNDETRQRKNFYHWLKARALCKKRERDDSVWIGEVSYFSACRINEC